MRKIFAVALFLVVSAFPALSQNANRYVKGRTLYSDNLPKIKITLDGKFKYVGKFDFTIRDIARGERFVFADAERKKVKRLFVAQFEGILPESKEFYRYGFANALKLGGHLFRHNVFAYSNDESRRENPKGEGVLTADFLKAKGYLLEDEMMASRFLTVPDAEKKHELILFYIENVKDASRSLADFYRAGEETEIWKQISAKLDERSRRAFTIRLFPAAFDT